MRIAVGEDGVGDTIVRMESVEERKDGEKDRADVVNTARTRHGGNEEHGELRGNRAVIAIKRPQSKPKNGEARGNDEDQEHETSHLGGWKRTTLTLVTVVAGTITRPRKRAEYSPSGSTALALDSRRMM